LLYQTWDSLNKNKVGPKGFAQNPKPFWYGGSGPTNEFIDLTNTYIWQNGGMQCIRSGYNQLVHEGTGIPAA
jgi:hypothetical protein